MTRYSFLLLLFMTHAAGGATVYKSVGADGRVTYSDQPPKEAVSVEAMELAETPATDDAQQLAAKRIEEMVAATERLQRDRSAREQARNEARLRAERDIIVPYPVIEEHHYHRYPRVLPRYSHFPNIHRGRYPIKRGRDFVDRSSPPPDSAVLTPNSRLLTPQ